MISLQTLYESSFFLAALVIGVSALCYQLFEGRTEKRQNIIFLLILVDLLISAAMSLLCACCQPYALEAGSARTFYDLGQYLYFLSHTLMAPLFYTYVVEVSGAFYRQRTWRHILLMLPCVVTELLVIINPFTHWVYYTDLSMNFIRNTGEVLVYCAAAFYFVMSAVFLHRYWHSLTSRRHRALMYSYGLVLTGVLLQLFFPKLYVELLFEALGFMGTILYVEKEDDRLDAPTGVYNRGALLSDIKNYADAGRPFLALCVRITDSDIIQRITGASDGDALLDQVAAELTRFYPAHKIYRTAPASFLLLGTEMSIDQMRTVAGVIMQRFEGTWERNGAIVRLSAVLLLTSVPDEFPVEDVLLLSDEPLPAGQEGSLLTGEALSFFKRNVDIEEAVARGLAEQNFTVYYRPVYDWKKRTLTAAEAILCLRDQRVGTLWQEDFLALSTENGSLDRLGDFLLREVSMFLGSGIPTELGLTQISLAVPAVQCMQPAFLLNLRERVEKYNVRPAQIDLAIRDLSLVQDTEAIDAVLKRIRDMGFSLTLDRYGVGNSGIHTLNLFPYDTVAIDLDTIGQTGDVSVRRTVLLHTIRLLGALQNKIFIRGLKSEEQLQTLEEADVDFVGGPLFSGPVSQNELIAILRATDMSRQEEAKARAQSEAKSSFLANMSHEIRTPINAILGMNEMILRESTDDAIRSYAHDIARAGTSLLALINDVLDFSKIEAGSMELVEVSYDLSSVIHDVMNMIRVKTDEKGLSLSLDVDERLPEHLSGDEMRLRQILINLLNNAVKYTEKGGVTLRMRGGYAEGKNVVLICDIIDTGIGIKEEEQNKLFDKFRRLDLDTNRTVEGSGLGLSITANLVALMGGTIEVQSMYGVGSTFTAKLSQRVVDWTPIGNVEERYRSYDESQEADKEAFVAPTARILVVDDTHMNLTVIRALLKRTHLLIDTAKSGQECLARIRTRKYDAIFLDYRMPEMDGSETLRRMRTDTDHKNTDTPVIVLTANALAGAKERFLSEGFDDYLAKPIDTKKMEAVLIRHLPKEKVLVREGVR